MNVIVQYKYINYNCLAAHSRVRICHDHCTKQPTLIKTDRVFSTVHHFNPNVMELRSGRILCFAPCKAQQNVTVNFTSSFNDEQEIETLEEIKSFFRFLFYHCCKNIGYKEWINTIEQTRGRKVFLDELLNWKADESFWRDNFQQIWFRMRRELPCSVLLQAFDFFVKNEYSIKPENPEFIKLKFVLRNYIAELYHHNNSIRILQLMHEQKQVDVDFRKKHYLRELASDLASQIVKPLFNNSPCTFTWDTFFRSSKSRHFYVSEVEGGRTVIRSTFVVCNFGMGSIPKYHFRILETGEKFTSPEQNGRKAFLLYRKLEISS